MLEHTAHSVNIKERLDFSCALFAPDGVADRERAAHSRAPGLDGRQRAEHPALEAARARRRLPAEHAVQRRHAPARSDGRDAGVRRARPAAARTSSRAARTTPTSAAARRARCRRRAARSTRKACCSTACRSSPAASYSRPRCARRWRAADSRRAIPTRTSPISKRSSPRTRAASSELERLIARFGVRTVERYMRHVQHNAAACVRAAIARLRDGRFTVELDGGERICVAVSVDATRRRADSRLHGHLARERGQLQRADVDRARGRAVRVPDAGPREHSAQRRLPRAADDRAAAGQPARSRAIPAAVVAGNVETSQCITDALLAALDACAGRARHDEQLHVRQRAPPVLRDAVRRRRRGAGIRRARAPCTRT